MYGIMNELEPDNLNAALEFIEAMFTKHFSVEAGNRVLNVYEDTGSSDWFIATQNEFGYLMIKKDPDQIIKLANQHSSWFYWLEDGIYYADMNEHPVPQIVRKFYAPYLKGIATKPKKTTGPKPDTEFYVVIKYALMILKDLGIPPTKNQERSEKNTASCGVDYLEKILKKLGKNHISASTKLQDIWYRQLPYDPFKY